MEKLRNGKWKTDIATKEEFYKVVNQVKEVVEKYNWGEKVIHPYSWGIKINDFVNGWKDYERCTFSSKRILILEVNGLIDILEHWVKIEEEEKITVKLIGGNKDGEIKQFPKSFVEDFIDCGLFVVV